MSRPATFPVRFGPYELLGEIARGGMAEVHFALKRDRLEGPLFALKRILPQFSADLNFRRFFDAEIDLTRRLRHPNIVSVVDHGEIDGMPFLAMEYIHGRALNRILHSLGQQGKRLPIPFAVHIGVQAIEALHHAHGATDEAGRELNVVMCDISPSNIMVSYAGEVKLIDFGIATSRMKFFEQIGMLKGKKNYMAPEQLRGMPLDQRADVFALGIVMHELISSQSLFGGRSEFEVEQVLRSGALPRLADRVPSVPPALEEAISRALALNPDDRYSTAGEFAAALTPFARLGKGSAIESPEVARVLQLFLAPLIRYDDARRAQVMARQLSPEPDPVAVSEPVRSLDLVAGIRAPGASKSEP